VAESPEITWTTTKPLSGVRTWAQSTLIPVFQDWCFKTQRVAPDHIVLVRKRSPWPLAFISFLAFWITPTRKEQVVVTFTADNAGHTRMTVIGDLPSTIASVLQQLPQATG